MGCLSIKLDRKEKEMFRRGFKKILCTGLILTILLGLSACGKKNVTEEEVNGWGENNALLAMEFVYGEDILKLPETLGNASVQEVTKIGSDICAVWEIYGSDEMPESSFKLMTMQQDGSNMQFVNIQNGIENKVVDEQSYAGYTQFAFADKKQLYGIKEYYTFTDTEMMDGAEVSETSLCCWDFTGNLMWEHMLELEDTDGKSSIVRSILPNPNGGVYIVFSGDDTEIQAVTEEGNFQERKSLSAIDRTLLDFTDLVVCKNGILRYTYMDEKKSSTMWMNTLDISKDMVGEAKQLPDSLRTQGYIVMADGEELADIVYSTTTGVYASNMGDLTAEQIMSFINSDVPTTNMNHIVVLDETRFIGFYYDDYNHSQVVSIFTKKNVEDMQEKTVLVLAGYYVPNEVKNRVIQFNKTNPEYRIVIKEYYTYDTMEDGMAGYNQLNMDILGRGLPDILIADSYFPVSSYISKGLVANIDELIGKESIVGDRTSWTMKEMQEMMASMPEGTQSIGELTRSDFVQLMMQYCGNDFVDVETGKCNFNTANFVTMLEYARTLPEEFNWDEYGDDYWEEQDSQYRENRTILAECDVSNARYVNDYINGYFGEEISYIGFPSDTGNGAVVEAGEQYLISASSEHIDGAWEFVRYYLTEEYQNKVIMFPVNKEIFMERAMEATKNPYTTDRNGNKQEYEYKISIGGESIVLPNMTTEQVRKFIKFVESIDKCVYYDEDIEAIINEEVALFLAGQKSASDVAGIIQSRVEIYVNENR